MRRESLRQLECNAITIVTKNPSAAHFGNLIICRTI